MPGLVCAKDFAPSSSLTSTSLFEKDKGVVDRVLGEGGLPPLPANLAGKNGGRVVLDKEQGYPEE